MSTTPPQPPSQLPPNAAEPPPGVDPDSLPYYRCSLPEAVRRWFTKLMVFSGRAGRAEYWWVVLVSTVGWTAVDAAARQAIRGDALASWSDLDAGLPTAYTAVSGALSFVLTLSVSARRLHDVNRSAWWLLAWAALLLVGAVPTTAAFPVGARAGGEVVVVVVALVALVVLAVLAIVLFVWSLSRPDGRGVRFDRPPTPR